MISRIAAVGKWLTSLATSGMLISALEPTKIATGPIKLATNWDATRIIGEALLTDEPNDHNYLRNMEFDSNSCQGYSDSLNFSLSADPLPPPPPLSSDSLAAAAIVKREDLFKIISPIHVPRFANLLEKHPNQLFVNSILRGLTEGFWPMSSLPSRETVIYENHVSGPEAETVLGKARDKELKFNRYSKPFNTLSPGMKVAPLCLAQNKSGKTRMCTDMSYGKPSPNDLIEKSSVSIQLDTISSFIPHMLRRRRRKEEFIIWKSDCDSAFRTLPVCFQQQFRQIVKIGNQFHVDRCVNFGSSASPRIWCSYFSLILWIAATELQISEFNSFMDDTWGLDLKTNLVTFKDQHIPLNQAKFLELFDYLNVPWNWEKQLWGSQIEVIGHWIDCEAMTISLADEKRIALAEELELFASQRSQPLVKWARVTGWANWGLNIFPLGRWALQSSWDKMAGKTKRNALVPGNQATTSDLRWLSKALMKWEGRQLLESFFWSLESADATFFCDACPSGLGIWNPGTNKGFHHNIPPPSRDIYWAELTSVVTAILMSRDSKARRVVIFTDSENVVNLFSSHRAIDLVRLMFKTAIDVMLDTKLEVKVKHVSGERNVIADLLSRNNLDGVKTKIPSLKIEKMMFLPPHMDGGIKKSFSLSKFHSNHTLNRPPAI